VHRGMAPRSGRMIGLMLTLALAGAGAGHATILGVEDTRFTLDGEEVFLLGISYYAAQGASAECMESDMSAFAYTGINWIRVWATWDMFGEISAVDPSGAAREPYLTRLKSLVSVANERGIVVDLTLARGVGIANQVAHLQAVRTLAEALKPWRNVYFDVANERNIKDARYVSLEECGELRDAIKEIDPARLVTASHGGDISREELADYLRVARVDFITPHRPRNGASPAGTQTKTQEYLQWMAELGKIVPVHYQEPFRRDYGRWQPELADFVADLRGAITGGAAGWCLHNGSPRGAARDDTGPRRSFDLSERCLMAQLDAVELAVLGEMSRALD